MAAGGGKPLNAHFPLAFPFLLLLFLLFPLFLLFFLLLFLLPHSCRSFRSFHSSHSSLSSCSPLLCPRSSRVSLSHATPCIFRNIFVDKHQNGSRASQVISQ